MTIIILGIIAGFLVTVIAIEKYKRYKVQEEFEEREREANESAKNSVREYLQDKTKHPERYNNPARGVVLHEE